MLPLIIGGVGAGAVLAAGAQWYRERKARRALTPERKAIHEAAMTTLKNPDQLRALAGTFDRVGLATHAELLRKRAALRELPAETKQQRADAFRMGMTSKDAAKVEGLAMAFQNEGATSAAANLRVYASGLTSPDVGGVERAIHTLSHSNLKPATRSITLANLEERKLELSRGV
jgi:hypothetical protein